jgi:DnaJ-class molecular chaperone
MGNREYYDVLGVPRDATADQIKSAYRKMARKYHPDVSKSPDAAEKFKEATEAYEVLCDPEKRKTYDRFGHAGPGGPFGGRQPRWAGTGGQRVSFSFGDIFGRGGSGFMNMGLQDILDALRGGGSGRSARREARGADSEYHLTLDFLQAVRGTSTRLRISRPQPGGGTQQETIEVGIPPGVHEGSRVRVRGKGQMAGGAAGDLYIQIHVRPHEWFWREGDDVYVHVPISIAEAALGAKVDVPTIDGIGTVTIPPGTASSKRLRLRGKGVKRKGREPGDQYVVIEIVPPRQLGEQQRELLRRFGELDAADPRAECPWRQDRSGHPGA